MKKPASARAAAVTAKAVAQLASDEVFIGNVVTACQLAAEMLANLPTRESENREPEAEKPSASEMLNAA